MKYVDKIYIISRTSEFERRAIIQSELSQVGADNYEFIDAIEGDNIGSTQDLLNQGVLAKEFKDPNGIITKNIIACAMSHRKAQQKFLDDGVSTALILEDDIVFTREGLKFMISGEMDKTQEALSQTDWGVFIWGSAVSEWMPVYDIGLNPLFEYKRYLPEWAAHAYQVNRKGALGLIQNNTPIQYAADVNLECSNVKIYCPIITCISQRFGDFERPKAEEMHEKYGSKILHDTEKYGGAFFPTTGIVPAWVENIEEARHTQDRSVIYFNKSLGCSIPGDIEFNGVHWEPFTNHNGDALHYWTSIVF